MTTPLVTHGQVTAPTEDGPRVHTELHASASCPHADVQIRTGLEAETETRPYSDVIADIIRTDLAQGREPYADVRICRCLADALHRDGGNGRRR